MFECFLHYWLSNVLSLCVEDIGFMCNELFYINKIGNCHVYNIKTEIQIGDICSTLQVFSGYIFLVTGLSRWQLVIPV